MAYYFKGLILPWSKDIQDKIGYSTTQSVLPIFTVKTINVKIQ